MRKYKKNSFNPILILLLLLISFHEISSNHSSEEVLQQIDPSFKQSEACVICQYTFQKVAKLFDTASECPDSLDINFQTERQRKWRPDPQFFSKWKVLFQAKLEHDRQKQLGYNRDGDHIYYISSQKKNLDQKQNFPKKLKPLNLQEDNFIRSEKIIQNQPYIQKTETQIKADIQNSKTIQLQDDNNGNLQNNQRQVDNLKNNNNEINLHGSLQDLHQYNQKSIDRLTELSRLAAQNLAIRFKNNNQSHPQKIIKGEKPAKTKLNVFQQSLRFKNKGVVLEKEGDISYKNKREQFYINLNNANNLISENTNTTAESFGQDNCGPKPSPKPTPPDDDGPLNNKTGKLLTYIDVKHPKTTKILDRNKGTLTTVTDLGQVYKTIVLDPNNKTQLHEVEHRLDKHFKDSDKVLHQKDISNKIGPILQEYNRVENQINQNGRQQSVRGQQRFINNDFPNQQARNIGHYNIKEEEGGVKQDYNLETSIDYNLQNSNLKRVHTNKLNGIEVNGDKYDYGKTFVTQHGVQRFQPQQIQKNKNNNNNQNDNSDDQQIYFGGQKECCQIEPCLVLPPCKQFQPRQQNPYIATSFLQIERVQSTGHNETDFDEEILKEAQQFIDNNMNFFQKSSKVSQRHKKLQNVQTRLAQQLDFDGENVKIRRRSRFPDQQWKCADHNLRQIIQYICNEEIAQSFMKYCKAIQQQINVVIESFLYHDKVMRVCQNINMCEK